MTSAGPGGGLGVAPMPEIDFSEFGAIETLPLTRINKLTGQFLHRNWVTVPHVTQFDEADITELEKFRKQLNEEHMNEGIRVTVLAFLMKALVSALKEYPRFNSSLDATGENLVLKKYIHIGVAVDTPDGLVVPVIHDVDRKGLFELARELGEVSRRAREGQLKAATQGVPPDGGQHRRRLAPVRVAEHLHDTFLAELVEADRGVQHAKVVTAVPMPEDLADRLQATLASFTGKTIVAPMRIQMGVETVPFFSSGASLVALILVFLIFWPKEHGDERPRSLGEIVDGMLIATSNFRFITLILITAGFWAIQGQLYASMPDYVLRMAGETYKPEWYANINPLVVVICVVPVTHFIRKWKPEVAISVALALVPFGAVAGPDHGFPRLADAAADALGDPPDCAALAGHRAVNQIVFTGSVPTGIAMSTAYWLDGSLWVTSPSKPWLMKNCMPSGNGG